MINIQFKGNHKAIKYFIMHIEKLINLPGYLELCVYKKDFKDRYYFDTYTERNHTYYCISEYSVVK